MNRSIYLDKTTNDKFSARCLELGLDPGIVTQKLIQLYINTPINLQQPKGCFECQYFKLAQAGALESLERLNKLTDLFLGGLVQRKR
jgi:hypothetical protein